MSRTVRLPWIRHHARPVCPGCAGDIDLCQPDTGDANRLLGVCTNPACACWTFFHRVAGVWRTAQSIPADDRRNPPWTPARPAAPETAGRA